MCRLCIACTQVVIFIVTDATNERAIKINLRSLHELHWYGEMLLRKGTKETLGSQFLSAIQLYPFCHISQMEFLWKYHYCSWHEAYSINRNVILFVLILFCRVAYVGRGDEETPVAPSTPNGRVHLFDWHAHVHPLSTQPAEIHR